MTSKGHFQRFNFARLYPCFGPPYLCMSLGNSAIPSHTTSYFYQRPPLPLSVWFFSKYWSKTHYSLWLKSMKNSIKITHMTYCILSYFLVNFSHFPAFMIFGHEYCCEFGKKSQRADQFLTEILKKKRALFFDSVLKLGCIG